MNEKKIVILGAGISGLSFAYKALQAGHRPLILESTDRVGGCFDSLRFDDFAIELGAHTCYNSYTGLISMIEKYHLDKSLVKRAKVSFKVLHQGKIEKITKHLSFSEIFASLPKIFFTKKNVLSVQEYYQSILGKNNYKNILGPSFNAVLSQNAGPFPADSLFKKRERRKDILRSYTLATGLQTITETVAADKNLVVQKNCTVETIVKDGPRFKLRLNDGQELIADALVFATPVSISSAYLKMLDPDIYKGLQQIESVALESVGVIVRKDKIQEPPFAGLIPTDDKFYSVVSRDVCPHEKYRGFTFHFRPGELSQDEKKKKILQVLKITAGDIVSTSERSRILPKLTMKHRQILDQIDQALVGKNIFLCGNYFQGLAIEDCINRSFSEFQRLS